MPAPAFIANRIPPPVIAIAVALLMLWLNQWGQPLFMAQELRWLGAVLFFCLGLGIEISAIRTFRQLDTTINPLTPKRTSHLVTHGIYRHTRNPMYVGLLCQLLALVCYLASPMALIGLPVFVYLINWLQIEPEEAVLRELYGEEYMTYKRRVRRWF